MKFFLIHTSIFKLNIEILNTWNLLMAYQLYKRYKFSKNNY